MNDTNNPTPAISLQDILIWIIRNQANTEAMDAINRQSYPYTSKFQERAKLGMVTMPKVEGGYGSANQ